MRDVRFTVYLVQNVKIGNDYGLFAPQIELSEL